MELLQSGVVVGLLWVVAALATIWVLGPAVGFALRLGQLEIEVSENPLDAEPRGDDAAYERKFRQLVALGFRPAGKTVETCRFATPLHWSWRSDGSRQMASPDGKCFVGLHRVAGADPLRTTASTIFEGGGLLETASPGVGFELDNGNDRRIEAGDVDAAALIAKHQANVEAHCRDRHLVVTRATFREYAAETKAFGRRALPQLRRAGLGVVLSLFVLPAFGILQGAGLGGAPAWLAPAGICGAAVLFAVARFAVLPGKVPIAARMALLMAVISLPTFAVFPLLEARGEKAKQVRAAVDHIAADPGGAGLAEDTGRIVAYGPKACRAVLRRLDDPSTSAEARRALHAVLVKLRGGDLGDGADPWRSWCAEATGAK